MLTRRGFFGRLFGGAVAVAVAPVVIDALPTTAPPLAFHENAFGLAMHRLNISLAAEEMRDRIDRLAFEHVYRNVYDAPAGEVVTIRMPRRWQVKA